MKTFHDRSTASPRCPTPRSRKIRRGQLDGGPWLGALERNKKMFAVITRSHHSDTTQSTAVYSDCETYRYSLTRVWQTDMPKVMFVMLNPSTADELQNDPTVERCEQRARRLGFGGFRVTNIFAYRATAPQDMKNAKDPVGPDNAQQLALGVAWADQVIAAWGVHGAHLEQGSRMSAVLKTCQKPLFHLGLTKDGHPKHPLYLPYAQLPVAWELDR